MSANIKPIKVYGQHGPNPPKVAMIVKELDIPHEIVPIPISDVKKPEYVAVNPNGRVPAIEDPNFNITIWESGAIIDYLLERYDTEHRLSFPAGTPEYYLAKQWLYFQVSGQGPYFGQAAWFKKFHPEKVPSALERYSKEVDRVSGVLEAQLARQETEHSGKAGFDGPWLVGNKLSYVDLAFLPWQKLITAFVEKDLYDEDKYPHLKGWLGKMVAREKVKDVLKAAGFQF
ncbi:glutathione S- transferase, nitrogen catabolite repression regulator [Knufia obscura]|uniref:Glutathione S- transferase, nitrogen catabolite repression regulator n=2 Tax=Knufia TaxID=430999 RepID=A0AAN8EK80_9EURO|nr:glutathione S- transferase, nitrogen catabolite repression regulator [Knufia obscura]KAK5953333.1 glutathione S- transferase, nitrogen catabolite repression regulator [Knufia fluminis]